MVWRAKDGGAGGG